MKLKGLLCCAVILPVLCARGPAEPWRLSHEAGVRAFLKKDYAEAERRLTEALAQSELTGTAPGLNTVTVLNSLGLVCAVQNRQTAARKYYLRAVKLTEQMRGAEDPALAGLLTNLGALELRATNAAAAENHFRRALFIEEKAYGVMSPGAAKPLSYLARSLRMQSRTEEAETALLRALNILRQNRAEAREVLGIFVRLADIYRDLRRPAAEETMWEGYFSQCIGGPASCAGHPQLGSEEFRRSQTRYVQVLRENGKPNLALRLEAAQPAAVKR